MSWVSIYIYLVEDDIYMEVGVCYQDAECTVHPGCYRAIFIQFITYLVYSKQRQHRSGYIIRFAIP